MTVAYDAKLSFIRVSFLSRAVKVTKKHHRFL